jgi:uncharacterized protein (TIGR00251 family)
MMSFEDAIRPASDGAIIDIEASPGAKETKVPAGYNQWRKRLLVKLKAPPERGRANVELIDALARLLNVPSVRIEITSGATDSRKSVKVRGMAREDIVKVLRGKI